MHKLKLGTLQAFSLCSLGLMVRPGITQPIPQAPFQRLSPKEYFQQLEQRTRAEFAEWRYPGALIDFGDKHGTGFLLNARTKDDTDKVWSFYMNKLSTDSKTSLSNMMSWNGKSNLHFGKNPVLDISYILCLTPGITGRILCQKGQESVCVTICPIQPHPPGYAQTAIELLKVKALELSQENDPLDYPPNVASFPIAPSPW